MSQPRLALIMQPRMTPRFNVNAGNDAVGLGGRDAAGNPGDQTAAANTLCALGKANGITCAVVSTAGKHDWPFAVDTFAASLPWLAGQLGTPGVPRIPLPGPVNPTSVN